MKNIMLGFRSAEDIKDIMLAEEKPSTQDICSERIDIKSRNP